MYKNSKSTKNHNNCDQWSDSMKICIRRENRCHTLSPNLLATWERDEIYDTIAGLDLSAALRRACLSMR